MGRMSKFLFTSDKAIPFPVEQRLTKNKQSSVPRFRFHRKQFSVPRLRDFFLSRRRETTKATRSGGSPPAIGNTSERLTRNHEGLRGRHAFRLREQEIRI